MMRRYAIRLAGDNDVEQMLALRSEAETWMHQAGIHQWVPEHHTHGRALLRESVDAATAWVVHHAPDAPIAATVTLDRADADFWTEADDPDDAVYVYKMIVAREHAGRDLGGGILDWAGRRAAAQHKRWLRLDCRRDNHKLHRYYTDRGFDLVRIVHTPLISTHTRYTGALFQRPAAQQQSNIVVEKDSTARLQ